MPTVWPASDGPSPCTGPTVHRLLHTLQRRSLTFSPLLYLNPFATLLVASQYGHLCGRPLPMMITSRSIRDARLYMCFGLHFATDRPSVSHRNS